MNARLFVFVIVIHMVTIARAQETTNASTSFGHDLGFNTYFVIQGLFQSQEAPFSFMYKKYRGDAKALRLGADLSFYSNNSESQGATNNSFTDNSFGEIRLAIGFENQLTIGGKWMWYYGGDLVPIYSFNKSDTHIDNDTKSGSVKNSTAGLGVRPFVGIRFNISPRLYISAEASPQLTYSISKSVSKSYNPEQTTKDLQSNNLSFDINPASAIFIFYRF